MDLHDKVIIITGGGSGIGAAMARRFATAEPRALVVSDLDADAAASVAKEVGGIDVQCDVSDDEANRRLIESTEDRFGPIDLFCANAGYAIIGDEQTETSEWDRMWSVNVMSHVFAAKHLVPAWLARGEGYFLSTVSAAGLLTNLKAAQYSVTKHAALSFSEWLSVTYGDRGIKVSALCPMFVKTPLLTDHQDFMALDGGRALEPEEVADAVAEGLEAETFLILPHPSVEKFFQYKANDYDGWIGGMRKLQSEVFPDG